MKKLSNDAFATLAMCGETKKIFGITVDKVSNKQFTLVWAFPIDIARAHREGFDKTHVKGSLSIDDGFQGCPYCGAKQFYMCENCGTIICYHGQKSATCPKCGNSGEFHIADEFDITGGGY